MVNLIQIALIILLLPASVIATTCAPNDIECKQITTMKNLDIKPTPVQKLAATPEPSDETTEPTQQPFDIPPPTLTKPKETTPDFDQPQPTTSTQKPTTQKQPTIPRINIFAPKPPTTTDKTTKSSDKTKQQPYNIPPPTEMQYR